MLKIKAGTIWLTWDELTTPPWTISTYLDFVQEELLTGDWTRGPAGTYEVGWEIRGWFVEKYQRGNLAESWEVPDNETIIFHLRKGVRWHNKPPVNGRELVADDVVYSLKWIYTTPTTSMYGMAGEGGPKDVYATDKYTVVVKTRPGFTTTTMDYVAGWTRIYPPEIETQYGNQNVDARSIGTGPYIITNWVPNSSIEYVKNPNYWDTDHMLGEDYRLPYIDNIKAIVVPDVSARGAAMRTAKVDVYRTGIAWEEAATLNKTASRLVWNKYTVCGRYWIGMRLDKNLPYDDIRVRRVLMMAINHQEMVDTLYGGNANILSCPVAHIKEWVRAYTPLEKLPP